MKTKYNLDLDVADRSDLCPSELYSLSVACFKKAGLLGEKHVDEIGRVYKGFDSACREVKEAKFDIFYRANIDENFRDLVNRWKLTISGFDTEKMRALDCAESCLEILERLNPLASLPLSIYSSIPTIASREIHTPAGLQSLHAHLPNHDFIRFIKPKNDKFLWDYDTLTDFLFDRILSESIPEDKGGNIERLKQWNRLRKTRKYQDLYSRLVSNIGSIDEITL